MPAADPLIAKALELIDIETEANPQFTVNLGFLQRHLRIGYQAAGVLLEKIHEAGIERPAPIEVQATVTSVLPEKSAVPVAGDDLTPAVGTATPDEERLHAEHSPSSLKYKAICPGFRNDQASDKTAADRGTLGHKAAELEDAAICGDDDDLAVAAQKCIDYIVELREKLEAGATKGISRLPGGAKLPLSPTPGMVYEYTEIKVHYDGEWGFFDKLFLDCDARSAHLIDHKFAWNYYEADAPQFWAYIYGIFNAVPWLENVIVIVLHPFRNEADVESFDAEKINLSITKVLAIVTRARANDPAAYRTGPQCEYCGFRTKCSKINELALEIAQKYDPELIIPTELQPENISDPLQMARAKLIAPVLEKWVGGINAYALAMAREGTIIPGFHLSERAAKFAITDAAIAYATVQDIVSPEEFASCSKTNIGDLEKVYAANAQKKAIDAGEKKPTKKDLVAEVRTKLLDAAAANNDGTVHVLTRIKGAAALTDSESDTTEESVIV